MSTTGRAADAPRPGACPARCVVAIRDAPGAALLAARNKLTARDAISTRVVAS